MFVRYKKYFYRFNRRIEKMLLVKENIGNELREAILSQITNSLGLETNSDSSDEVKVHELRKVVKRCRALLKLLRPALDESSFYDLDEILGRSARLLTDQREATVNLRTFINLTNRSKTRLPDDLKNNILNELTKNINQSYNLAQNNFPNQLHESLLSLMLIKDKFENLILHHIEDKDLKLLLRKTYQKTAKLYGDARFSLDTEIIHKWRKFTKHLLFQLKLSPFQTKGKMGRMISSLEELSDTLGNEHDLAIMEDYLKSNFEFSSNDQQQIHLIVSKERSRLQKRAFIIGAKLFS